MQLWRVGRNDRLRGQERFSRQAVTRHLGGSDATDGSWDEARSDAAIGTGPASTTLGAFAAPAGNAAPRHNLVRRGPPVLGTQVTLRNRSDLAQVIEVNRVVAVAILVRIAPPDDDPLLTDERIAQPRWLHLDGDNLMMGQISLQPRHLYPDYTILRHVHVGTSDTASRARGSSTGLPHAPRGGPMSRNARAYARPGLYHAGR